MSWVKIRAASIGRKRGSYSQWPTLAKGQRVYLQRYKDGELLDATKAGPGRASWPKFVPSLFRKDQGAPTELPSGQSQPLQTEGVEAGFP